MVLAIIATVAAIAGPRYANALINYRVDGVSRRIVADLDLARSTARSTSKDVTVSFDIANNRYTVPGVKSFKSAGLELRVDLGDEPYHAKLVAVNLGGDHEVVFDGYGIPDSGGTITVSCGTSARVITLDPFAGLASVD